MSANADDPSLPIEGSCRCGKVWFRISAPPMLASACHCRGCQRMTGSAFSTTLSVPSSGFEVIAGQTVIGGIHGDQARHYHCEWCKSWMFTRIEPDMGFVNVRPAMLDHPEGFAPYVEMQVAEKLPWASTGAPRSYDRFPEFDEYEGLMREYAAWLQAG